MHRFTLTLLCGLLVGCAPDPVESGPTTDDTQPSADSGASACRFTAWTKNPASADGKSCPERLCNSSGQKLYCADSVGEWCCSAYGHPEVSCPSGTFCTAQGTCANTLACAGAPPGLDAPCGSSSCRGNMLVCDPARRVCRSPLGGPCMDASWCAGSMPCINNICGS